MKCLEIHRCVDTENGDKYESILLAKNFKKEN